MPAIKEKEEFDTCPFCGSSNIFEDDGLWYCNSCVEVWEENNK